MSKEIIQDFLAENNFQKLFDELVCEELQDCSLSELKAPYGNTEVTVAKYYYDDDIKKARSLVLEKCIEAINDFINF
jgi:hypothetical protein